MAKQIEMIPECIGGVLDHVPLLVTLPIFDEKYLWNQLRPIIPYPTGRCFRGTLSQALRAWLRSCCPSGTKAIRPSTGLAFMLALMGYSLDYAFMALQARGRTPDFRIDAAQG